MRVYAIISMQNMPAVIFAIVIGTMLGLWFHLGKIVNKDTMLMQKPVARFFSSEQLDTSQEESLRTTLVTAIVLFCASGTGKYSSLDSSMTGDHSFLIAKSILDFYSNYSCMQLRSCYINCSSSSIYYFLWFIFR